MKLNQGSKKQALFVFFSVLLMVVAVVGSFYFWRGQRMSTNWMGPFLSAAQHLNPGKQAFLIDIKDLDQFKRLDSAPLEDSYIFRQSTNPQPFVYGSIGYAYLIKAATLLFPFAGHQLAIILLQSLFHIILCSCFVSNKAFSYRIRVLFLVLYALNPLVLRLVTFNFYYFWQVIPAVGVLFLHTAIKNKLGWALVLLSLPLVLLARSTTIFISAIFLILLFWKRSRAGALVYTLFLVGIMGWLYVPNLRNPWHTMYAGVGGYDNPDRIVLSDESSYALYQKHTGTPINSSTGGNFYIPAVQEKYIAITRQEYLSVLQKYPLLLAKNAVVYFFAAFSVGYVNKGPQWLNYLISASGLVLFLLLLYQKKYRLLFWMIMGIIGFVAYYPPIPAYMFGNYLLLAWGVIELVEGYWPPGSLKKTLREP